MQRLKQKLESLALATWYSNHWLARCSAILLLPLSWLYCAALKYRQPDTSSYRVAPSHRTGPLVIVIGNIATGGTGKTPLLIALATQLKARGFKPAVISRGHGGGYLKAAAQATLVGSNSDPSWVGDEPVLIARQLGTVPVVVCPKRQQALEYLTDQIDCDIVLSDDGLQHYGLQRHIEIALVDASRGFGNGMLLPSGPLREPLQRLQQVDIVIANGQPEAALQAEITTWNPNFYCAATAFSGLRQLPSLHTLSNSPDATLTTDQATAVETLQAYRQLHIVTGIGNPQRFLNSVKSLLGDVSAASKPEMQLHAFPDHYQFTAADLQLSGALATNATSAIVMTAKDAVKCHALAKQVATPVYVIDIDMLLGEPLQSAIESLLNNEPGAGIVI